jgi:DNA-binding transcriptional ArsR family regulator
MGCDVASGSGERRDVKLVQSLGDAMADPFRSRILVAVTERPGVTIREIAERLGETSRKVRYHMEALHGVGLVEVQGEVHRRGAIERRYRATTSNVIRADEERQLAPPQERRIALEVLKMAMGDATSAVASGHFAAREGHCATRLRGSVDSEGWDELADLFAATTEEARRVIERSGGRRETTGEAGVEVTGALFLFEAPIWNRE